VKASIRRLCDACRIVKRRGKLFVVCKENKKHKQRQGYHTDAAGEEALLPSAAAAAAGPARGWLDAGASLGAQLWRAG
jgi:large subunit ribosomal protein L36